MNAYERGYIAGMLSAFINPPQGGNIGDWFDGYREGKRELKARSTHKTSKASGQGIPKIPKAACLAVKRKKPQRA